MTLIYILHNLNTQLIFSDVNTSPTPEPVRPPYSMAACTLPSKLWTLGQVSSQAVLVVLVDTVGEGVLQLSVDEDASTFMFMSLRISYGQKVPLPLEDDDVLVLPMVDLLNLPAKHPPLETEDGFILASL